MLPSRMIFDDFLDDLDDFHPVKNANMKCDIYEKDGLYHIEMDAPGFNKEDILIECDEGNLKITATKKAEEKEDRKYLHRERKSFETSVRSFYLGNVDEDAIKAEFKDGILKITVPKEEKVNTKKTISID